MRKYIFSTDHKVIGIQYGITALVFLLLGFLLMAAMRWQIAYPNEAIPVVGSFMQKLVGADMVAADATGKVGVVLVNRKDYEVSNINSGDIALVALDALTNPAAYGKAFALRNDPKAALGVWKTQYAAMPTE